MKPADHCEPAVCHVIEEENQVPDVNDRMAILSDPVWDPKEGRTCDPVLGS